VDFDVDPPVRSPSGIYLQQQHRAKTYWAAEITGYLFTFYAMFQHCKHQHAAVALVRYPTLGVSLRAPSQVAIFALRLDFPSCETPCQDAVTPYSPAS